MAKQRWWRRKRGQKLTTPDGLSAVTLPPGYIEALSAYGLRGSYGHIYRTQPNVRAVVKFFSEVVAATVIKHYAEVPTTPGTPNGNLELEDSDLQRLLNRPAPKMARSRLWRETVADTMIYDVAYWQKVRIDGQVKSLVRVPPAKLMAKQDPVTRVIRWYETYEGKRFSPDDLVIFHGYDPEMMDGFISPLETLRRILAEEYAAGVNREHNWRNQARKGGVVERPVDAPLWDDENREAWRVETEGISAGAANSGRILLLEDGMKWNDSSWSPEEMEYLEARQLNRLECSAAFGIDPRLVFATTEAITSEIRTVFVQDRYIPFVTSMAEEIDVQLLPEMEPFDYENQFTRFDYRDKLRGSFIEEMKVLAGAVGGPIMTVDEGRDRWDLFPQGMNEVYRPLNSVAGGGPQASPQNPIETPGEQPAGITPGGGTAPPDDGKAVKVWLDAETKAWLDAEERNTHRQRVSETVRRHLSRQERTVASLLGALSRRASVTVEDVYIDEERWDRELAHDLEGLGYNGDSAGMARTINEMTKLRLGEALATGDLSGAFRWDEEVLNA